MALKDEASIPLNQTVACELKVNQEEKEPECRAQKKTPAALAGACFRVD